MPPVAATTESLLALLERLEIEATTHRHEPAFTVEQGNAVWSGIPGIHCKNLFLKDAKARLWLVVAPAERQIDLKRLPARIGSARLSFGSAELLGETLGIEPGSVTPFALLNDSGRRVTPVLDAWMMQQPLVNYHPLRNDMTTTVASSGLLRFLRHTGHVPEIVAL
ncbi:prolyl-tRNA synthetase associated domain-containing protein [Magnetospirillum sp. SS-4]|uniref:prolyl-tRNA synthetase associated domain-containing protein n=1 Tax=Magnetospirillum sp. SS-4 TaxID=2681465 RepID=UPI0013860423|nr:prolyl-tRNA synthetase associated domain-containing protein [Magnetospirillum sp. SS-4]CAA7620409.1 putative YbaK/aminoacyl-tRNA synthetase-associated domain [Magnetospirillum sp. SS-4]